MRWIFPGLMLVSNFGAALVYGWQGEYRRAAYFIASAVCVLAVAWDRR